MTDARLWREATERCLSIMEFLHNSRSSREVEVWRADELRAIAERIREVGMTPTLAERWIVRPVEDGLIKRFGHEVGPRLTSIFVEALGTAGSCVADA